MDFIDIWWNMSQESDINDLHRNIHSARMSSTMTMGQQREWIRLLQKENDELRLRVGVLIRLLIQRGTITTEEFSTAVNDARASITAAKNDVVQKRAMRRLPKPPKLGTKKTK